MTKRTVMAKHRTKGYERPNSILDDEEGTLVDANGEQLDMRWWEYYDLDSKFTTSAILVSLGIIWAIWYIFSGAAS